MPRVQCHRCGMDFLHLRAASTPRCPICGAVPPDETSTVIADLTKAVSSLRRGQRFSRQFDRPSPAFVRQAMARRAQQALMAREGDDASG